MTWFYKKSFNEYEKAYIDAVGKALILAQAFETYFSNIAIFAEVKIKKEKDIDFEEAYKRLQKKTLAKRVDTWNKAFEQKELSRISQIFKNAKEARNYIAHESMMPLVISQNIEIDNAVSEGEITEKLPTLYLHVKNLVEASDALARIEWSINQERGQPLPYIAKNYVEEITKWVFSEFSHEELDEIIKIN
jgi:hypothetical protein